MMVGNDHYSSALASEGNMMKLVLGMVILYAHKEQKKRWKYELFQDGQISIVMCLELA